MEHLEKRLNDHIYTIVRLIGSGGMAEVYKARVRSPESSFEKQVALKKILPSVARNDQFRKNFINEAIICGEMQHPNIVEVYNFHQDGQDLYLSMEFIDGLSLDDIFESYRRSEQHLSSVEILAILTQVLEGLEYAHTVEGHHPTDPAGAKRKLEIIHRDLKPSNILINQEGQVKIVDFGVAKAVNRRFETMEMTTKGTASYMAPEQIIGEPPVSRQSDIFSVGAILYELLTLKRLFDGNNVFQILKLVSDMDIDDHLAKTITGTDRKFLPMLRRALARDPSQRYASAEDMRRDLASFHKVTASDVRNLGGIVQTVRQPSDEEVEDARTRVVSVATPASAQSRPVDSSDAQTRIANMPGNRDGDDEEEQQTILGGDSLDLLGPRAEPNGGQGDAHKAGARAGNRSDKHHETTAPIPSVAASFEPAPVSRMPSTQGPASAPPGGIPVRNPAQAGGAMSAGNPQGARPSVPAGGAPAQPRPSTHPAGQGAYGHSNIQQNSGSALRNGPASPMHMPGVPPPPPVVPGHREHAGPVAQPAPTLHLSSVGDRSQQGMLPALATGAGIGAALLAVGFLLYKIFS